MDDRGILRVFRTEIEWQDLRAVANEEAGRSRNRKFGYFSEFKKGFPAEVSKPDD